MQRVPGLRPTGQRPLVNRAPVRSRVQAPDPEQLAPPQLQPVAQPVDTFVRAPEPGEDNGLFNLAKTLSDLNPEIYKHLERKRRGSTSDALEYLQQHDIEEVNGLVRSGNTPEVLQTLEGRRVYAERRAREDAAEITRRYNEDFARGEGNLQELINSVTGESHSLYGEDDTFMAVYTEVMDPLLGNLRDTHQADSTALEMDRRQRDIMGAWSGRINDGLQLGEDPAFIVQSIFDDFPNNHDFLRIHPQQQQEMVLQLASQQVAAGNLDMAEAMLRMERKDGPYRGSLLNDPNTIDASSRLMADIDRMRAQGANQAAETAAYEAVIADAVEAAQGGSILSYGPRTITSADGSTRVVSQEEIERVVAERQVQDLATAAEYSKWTEDQAEQAEIEAFATSMLPHPRWVNIWRKASGQLSLQNLSEGNMPSDITEAFEQYRLMSAENAQYLTHHLDAKQRGFFDVANLLLEAGHVENEEQALQQAAIATMRMSPDSAEAQANWQRVNEAATSVVNDSDHWTGAGWQVTNQNDVKRKVNEYTTLYMLAGLGEAKALTAAQATYQRTHTNIMQAYVQNDPRVDMTQFKVQVDDYVAEWLAHPDRGDIDDEYDIGHLSIAQVGNGPGSYQIVDASTRIPLIGYGDYMFTTQSIQAWDAARQAAARETAITETVEASEPAVVAPPSLTGADPIRVTMTPQIAR